MSINTFQVIPVLKILIIKYINIVYKQNKSFLALTSCFIVAKGYDCCAFKGR